MTTNQIRGNTQIKDDSITEPLLNVLNVPASGQHLTWDGANLKWQHNLSTASILYLHNESADVAGYEKLLPVPANDPETSDVATVNSGAGEVLLDEYITDQIGTSILDGGLWEFNSYAKVDNSTGVTNIVIRVYKRNTGGTETQLFTVTTVEINSATTTLIQTSTVQPDFVINITDRLVVKYYTTTTSVANRTVTLYYEGTTNYSHIHTPFGAVVGSFLSLDDTPDTYASYANYVPNVKSDETGLEFRYPVSSGGGVSSLVLSDAGGSVKVGPGTDTNVQAYSGIKIHMNDSAQLSVRDDADNVEGGIFAHAGGNVYIGAWTNHPVILRTNNANTITISTAGDVYSVAWTDYSATSTITGWSSFTSKVIFYKKVGKLVFVQFFLEGTSDNATTNFTLPYTNNGNTYVRLVLEVRDNGTYSVGTCSVSPSGNTASFAKDVSGTGFSNSGTKRVIGNFWYESA